MIGRLTSLALGIWLMIAPALFNYGDPLSASDRIVGPIAAAASIIAISEVMRGLRWVGLAVAPWLLLSPLILGTSSLAQIAHHGLISLALASLAFIW